MAKEVIVKDGRVINLVNSPDTEEEITIWRVPDDHVVSVGDVFDPRDKALDEVDQVVFKILYRHENLIRQLIRAMRATSSAANTAANNEGLPTAANSADVTQAQFKTAVKALL